jgi:Rieske Fe-S protein
MILDDQRPNQSPPASTLSARRRSFLKFVVIGLASVVALMLAWGSGRFIFFWNGVKKKRELSVEALDKVKPGIPSHEPEAGVWLVKRSNDSTLLALDDRCPHLGCRQKWDPERGLFQCPCHGSEFDLEGNVTRGPASRSLPRLALTKAEPNRVLVLEKPQGEH